MFCVSIRLRLFATGWVRSTNVRTALAPLGSGDSAAAALTVSANAGRAALLTPSLALITMLEVVPTTALDGVPLSTPLAVLKLAQLGLLRTLKATVSPAGALLRGWKK